MKRFINVPLVFSWLSLGLLLSSCGANKPTVLSFEYLPAVYEHSYNEKPAQAYLVNSDSEYLALLDSLGIRQQDEIFYESYWAANSLLLVYGGMRPSSGYSLQTDSLIRRGKEIEIRATLFKPGDDCMVADVISYPFQLLAIPKSTANTRFKLLITEKSKRCR
jgi:hypothetical protein